ncbi:hypothetical protein BDZ89DRAFT_1246090 [Hymenopellis radicata]|nr:hypothetical protein BDZ89DRAFT_1246090 [Hymenopellis radicata]
MQQIASECSSYGAFTRRSLHHEEEYQSSVLLELLRTTNFPATDEQISHIRHTVLPTISDDMSSIDSKVASLHQAIRSMEEERERLMNIQKKYSNLISLHRTLPSEIWSKIFLYTSPRMFNAFNASGSIWKLSHVCQRWRNIALSLHSFWSTIKLCLPQEAQQEADVRCLEAVLQRSRQGPLDVSLSEYRWTPDSNPDPLILKLMLNIIFAESYRWREAHLSFSQGGWNTLYAPLHNQLPRLESLAIYFAFAPLGLGEKSVSSVFEDCPCLTKLTLAGGSTVGVEFPWDQITELDLDDMDLINGSEEERRECMSLIGKCPSLEVLSTPYWDSEDNENESPYAPITCSNMRRLNATSVSVIDALTLPSLQEVFLNQNPTSIHSDILYSFKQLLMRSNCLGTLTRLSLDAVPLAASPDRTLLSILSQTQNLTFLDLHVCIGDETDVRDQEQIVALMKFLEVVPTESVTFLPLLSSLDIRVLDDLDSQRLPYFGPVGSFASTVKTRWQGDDTLSLARLKRCHFAVHAWYLNTSEAIFRDSAW